MDKVFIEGLEIDALIGIYDWERRIRQTLRFDLEMGFDNRRPAASDDIADTLNYKAVSKRIEQFVRESDFGLVETLAERIAEIVRIQRAVAAPEAQQARRGARRQGGRRDHRAQRRLRHRCPALTAQLSHGPRPGRAAVAGAAPR